MRRIFTAPGCYIQGRGELGRLAEHCRAAGIEKMYLIMDRFIHDTYGQMITKGFEAEGLPYETAVFGGECSRKEIQSHRERVRSRGCAGVAGIGGGKTLDCAKAVSCYERVPVMAVPTSASTDAPCSRLAVIYTEEGALLEYLPLRANPDLVVVDPEVVAQAPARFLAAGMGDALSTYYEAAACVRSGAVTPAGGQATRTALALSRLCRDTLLACGEEAMADVGRKTCTRAVEEIVEANIYLSGVGFENGGLAAAHAVHNGLTVLEECRHALHGEKVAFGTLVQMLLEDRPSEEIKRTADFCKAVGLPVTLADLGLLGAPDSRLLEAAEASCSAENPMSHMPFEVKPRDVLEAMKRAGNGWY